MFGLKIQNSVEDSKEKVANLNVDNTRRRSVFSSFGFVIEYLRWCQQLRPRRHACLGEEQREQRGKGLGGDVRASNERGLGFLADRDGSCTKPNKSNNFIVHILSLIHI